MGFPFLTGHDFNSRTVLQPRYSLRLVEEVLLRQLAQTEVLPPTRFVFATMPIEQVGQQPAGVLFLVAVSGCLWNTLKQLRSQRLDSLGAGVDLFGRVAIFRLRSWNGRAARHHAGSHLFEPVPEPQRGYAVVLVVTLNLVSDFLRNRVRALQLQRLRHHEQAAIGIGQRHGSVESVEHFQVLDRVAFDSRAQALADDTIEVDEASGAEQSCPAPARASRSGPSAA